MDSDGHVLDASTSEEQLDVLHTPLPLQLAPMQMTLNPTRTLSFTPSTPDAEGGGVRKLNFNTKEAPTPGRYDARQRVGQPLEVFCRIKPALNGESVDLPSGERMIRIDGDSTVVCTAPSDSGAFKHGDSQSKFTFTRAFGPETSQEEVFNVTTKPLVDAFYDKGQFGLIFAYGITASGQTRGDKQAH